ncbi:MAG: site-2 protease family protein [Clostridia bacterium]|nr:site-2 protease family protein [Clostridia bacterium]
MFTPENILVWVIRLVIVLIALTFHEFAHGYAAYKMGDPTAKAMGRLSLNPLSHLNPIGFFSMLFFGFGWANPVPIYAQNFKNPKRGMAISAFAGPFANLLLAFASTLVTEILLLIPLYEQNFAYRLVSAAYLFFELMTLLNISLAIFNLIPVPPLDGSRILPLFLPQKAYFGIMRYEKYIGIGFFVFLLLDSRLGLGVIDTVLGTAVNAVYSAMHWVWELLPFFG